MGFVGSSAAHVLFQLRATGENSYPHKGYGARARVEGTSLVSVLTILAIKLIFTGGSRIVAIRKQMIMLVVGIKGQSAG